MPCSFTSFHITAAVGWRRDKVVPGLFDPHPEVAGLETPHSLARDWVLTSVVNEPERWHPWTAYSERGHRAATGQLGFCRTRRSGCFCPFMRRGGRVGGMPPMRKHPSCRTIRGP